MKQWLLVLIGVLFFCNQAWAQLIVDDININDLKDVQVCELTATRGFLSLKVTISIDYGQESNQGGSAVMDPATGKKRKFNSVVDALNFMLRNGWEYMDALAITHSSQNVYHFYFKRKKQEG